MPVTDHSRSSETLYQRDQYAKGGLGRWYWDYRDAVALSCLTANDARIVDIGCGEGLTLAKLISLFPQALIQGIDLLPENIAICRRFGLPVQAGDLYQLPFPDESFDAVLLMEVIEHLLQPETALRQIHRILKPKGKVIIVFPNDAIFRLARLATFRFKEAAYDPGHVRQWTPSAMRSLLRETGFDVASCRSIPFILWPLSLHARICGIKRP